MNKNGIINWVDISLLFPQKTAQECYNRWYNDLNFGFRKVNNNSNDHNNNNVNSNKFKIY